VVAERHKLIPSVYAVLDIQKDKYGQAEAVIYSGPIFIRIRSGKYDSSTAYSYSKDFDDLMVEKKLHNHTMTDGQSKPMVVMISDGKPDENPCYRKHASNPVERRMAPLSHDLAGIILPHDIFGSHLDIQLRTSDKKLEKRNFKMAKDVLASIGIKQILLNHFFPPPLLIQQKLQSICVASMGIFDNTTHFGSFLLSILMEGKLTPLDTNLQYFLFDWYCPTVNKLINDYLCSYCNQYYALKRALKIHIKKYKKFNLSKEPVLDIQDNESSETMQVDEEVVLEDLLETYPQQVQVQEKLIADR
ncbi:8162_t:CDS:2, partial [Racocetra persica]